MSDISLLAMSLLTQTQVPVWMLEPPPLPHASLPDAMTTCQSWGLSDVIPLTMACSQVLPETSRERSLPLFSAAAQAPTHPVAWQRPPAQRVAAEPSQLAVASPGTLNWDEPLISPRPRPSSGGQMYVQRRSALRAGQTYTRLPVDSFQSDWQGATLQPTYEEWVDLLNQEAQSMARGQGSNRLTVMVGDSLSLWYPTEQLSSDRFWLNQGISGDTSAGVLRRLSAFDQARPDRIHVMVGINDLRRGASDEELLSNIHQIMQRLRQQHPDAEVVVHSILPTRLPALPSDRIQTLNQQIARLAQAEQVSYLDLQVYFTDAAGVLHRDLTTDGIHLSQRGYAMWRLALQQFNLA